MLLALFIQVNVANDEITDAELAELDEDNITDAELAAMDDDEEPPKKVSEGSDDLEVSDDELDNDLSDEHAGAEEGDEQENEEAMRVMDEKAQEEAAKVDEHLTEEQRKDRMKTCLSIARIRLLNDKKKKQKSEDESETKKEGTDDVLEDVESFAAKYQISKQQAMEYLHMNIISRCYLDADQEKDVINFMADSSAWWENVENIKRLIGTSLMSIPRTLHKRQWELLRDLLKMEGERERDRATSDMIGSSMPSWLRFLYFVIVIGSIFGGGYWVLHKLTAEDREKINKKAQKKQKAAAAKDKKDD